MRNVTTASVEDARDYFTDELKKALERQKVQTGTDTVEYLAELLLGYLHSEHFFAKGPEGKLDNPILADLYGQYLHGSVEVRKVILKRLGDICLVITGIFPDSLKRKLVDMDYYFGMGGSAYHTLSTYQLTSLARGLFGELAGKFVALSNVLGELADRSGLQSNTDLLRLYEKWLMTGNERFATLLRENGIAAPVKVGRHTKQ